jgi:hypothetical protein
MSDNNDLQAPDKAAPNTPENKAAPENKAFPAPLENKATPGNKATPATSENKAPSADEEAPATPENNVQGWERAGSIAAGVVLLGKGVARGGIFGLLQIALGGVALKRGFTGHCPAKTMVQKGSADLSEVRGKIERAGDELIRMKDNAIDATKDAVAQTKDAIVDKPKP